MSLEGSVPLSLGELGAIDQQVFNKAGSILAEARGRLNAYEYDLAVRRAQESFELFLKSLFRFLQREYPGTHDLRKQIYGLTSALKEYRFDRQQIARLVLADSVLTLWRSPAFYGDEKLNVGGLFSEKEAALALSYADAAQLVCGVIREHAYRRATACETT